MKPDTILNLYPRTRIAMDKTPPMIEQSGVAAAKPTAFGANLFQIIVCFQVQGRSAGLNHMRLFHFSIAASTRRPIVSITAPFWGCRLVPNCKTGCQKPCAKALDPCARLSPQAENRPQSRPSTETKRPTETELSPVNPPNLNPKP